MAKKLKKFLIYHGEKAVLGVVALLCLWSMAGNLLHGKNLLPTAEGVDREVDLETVNADLSYIKSHLANAKETGVPEPLAQPEDLKRLIDLQLAQYKRPTDKTPLLWAMYNRPPLPKAPAVIIIPPKKTQDPPDKVRSAVAAVDFWQVCVGRDRVLVIARIPDTIRWPLDDEVNVTLWRKEIGPGREDLAPAVYTDYRKRSSGDASVSSGTDTGSGKGETGAKPGDDAGGAFGWDAFGGGKPAEKESSAAPVAQVDVATAYFNALREVEIAAYNDTRKLSDLATLPETPWVQVAPRMESLPHQLSDEEIAAVLGGAPLPKADAVTHPVNPTPGANTPANPVNPINPPVPNIVMPVAPPPPPPGPATVPNVPSGPAAPTPRAIAPGAVGAPEVDVESLVADVPAFESKYVAFVDDKGIQENTLYRYRMVVWMKGKPAPEKIMELPQYKDYDQRVEMADISWETASALSDKPQAAGMLAIPKYEVSKFLEAEKPFAGPFCNAGQPEWGKYIQRNDLNHVIGLRNSENLLTQLGAAYRNKSAAGYCFSFFTHTGVIITPVLKRLEISMWGGEGEVSLRVILAKPDGDVKEPTPKLCRRPPEVAALTWKDWILTEPSPENPDKRRPVWKDGKPVIIPIDQYYAKVKIAAPVLLGGKETVRDKEVDFSTDWELVDVKKCTWRITHYVKEADGTWSAKRTSERPDQGYIVLRNRITGKYKRMLKAAWSRPEGLPDTEAQRCEYIWDSELDANVKKLIEQHEAEVKAAAEAKAAEAKVAEDKKKGAEAGKGNK